MSSSSAPALNYLNYLNVLGFVVMIAAVIAVPPGKLADKNDDYTSIVVAP